MIVASLYSVENKDQLSHVEKELMTRNKAYIDMMGWEEKAIYLTNRRDKRIFGETQIMVDILNACKRGEIEILVVGTLSDISKDVGVIARVCQLLSVEYSPIQIYLIREKSYLSDMASEIWIGESPSAFEQSRNERFLAYVRKIYERKINSVAIQDN